MLELQAVSGGYDSIERIKEISLSFGDSGIVSIIGPNGCGKSTLLKILANLLKPMSGKALLDGRDIRQIGRLEYAKRVSFLPQVRSIPNMSVSSLVMHGRQPYLSYPRRYGAADKRIGEEAMELTGAIAYRHRNVQSLSGGERQKAYIAMSVAQDTDVMLMDEPTTYLDVQHQYEIMELAKKLRKRGKLIILVLHDLNLAMNYSDRMVIMDKGRVLAWEAPATLYQTGIIDKVFHIRTELIRFEGGYQLLFLPSMKEENT